jgi:hypothetical protein
VKRKQPVGMDGQVRSGEFVVTSGLEPSSGSSVTGQCTLIALVSRFGIDSNNAEMG